MVQSTVNDRVRVSRRALLTLGGVGALSTLSLAACSSQSDEQSSQPEADGDRPRESPMLTEQVDAGDLPEFDERLPVESDRLVVQSPEPGSYGGTFSGVTLGPGDEAWVNGISAYEPMLRFSPDLSEHGLPGILTGIDLNDEGTVFTLHLREGLRWSDGEPVSADDVMFAIEEVYTNTDLFSTPPSMLSVDGQPCSAERIDDLTVQLTFPEPKGNFIEMASRIVNADGNPFYYPKHYFEQFIPSLDSGAEAAADDAGFSDWTAFFEDRAEYWNNTDKPVLNAWVVMSGLNQGNVMTLERNPYYWKVDDEGAQLPFMDRLEFEIVQEEEVMLLKALNGEIDLHSRHFNQAQNRPVLAEAREDGNFDFVPIRTASANHMVVALNFNHPDEELRDIFRNKDFRIGLSHAIDRQEVIDTVYQRQGQPWQAAPHPESEFVDEEFGLQYTEFDVDLANQHLDDAGLVDTDSDGYRLRPDGQRIRFDVDAATGFPDRVAGLDLISRYWAEVGIEMRVNTIERTLFYDRKSASANQQTANVWGGDGGFRTEMVDPRWYFPFSGESNFAVQWAEWFQTRGQGDNAVEPPEQTRRQMELYWEILSEPDVDRQTELFREILQIAKDEFYVIGVALRDDDYGVVSNDLRNVAESYTASWLHMAPGAVNPSTWYFSDAQ